MQNSLVEDEKWGNKEIETIQGTVNLLYPNCNSWKLKKKCLRFPRSHLSKNIDYYTFK